MDFDILKLDNQLCFALYSCSREVIKLYTPHLEKLGLTYTQYVTLLALWEKDNITVKELGELLYLGNGTLVPLLKKLEAQGLIYKMRIKDDERNVYIRLTQGGTALKEKALEIPEKLICEINIAPQSAIDIRENLKQLLDSIANK